MILCGTVFQGNVLIAYTQGYGWNRVKHGKPNWSCPSKKNKGDKDAGTLILGIGDKNEVGKILIHHKEATKLIGVFIGLFETFLLVGFHQFTLDEFI